MQVMLLSMMEKLSELRSKFEGEMSTDKVKASPFNPVDHMETDEEIIEFIVDCYNEDPEGRVYLRACQFLGDSRGTLKTYEILQRATREIASRNQQPSLKHAIA